MPGRCARRAGDDAAQAARVRRAPAMSCGMRCAEMTCASYGTPKSSSMATACFMTSQSLEEPIITPTTGWLRPAEVLAVMTDVE